MIKMTYEQEKYNYQYAGSQMYDIKTEIDMDKDATVADCVEAFVKLMKIATYPIHRKSLIRIIEELYEAGEIDE